MQTGKGNRKKGICFTILPKQAALPCERPHEETERQRDENPAPCFILHPKKKPAWEEQDGDAGAKCIHECGGEKKTWQPKSGGRISLRIPQSLSRGKVLGEENRKKKKPGDRGEANLRRQNHEARFQPRTKEQQKNTQAAHRYEMDRELGVRVRVAAEPSRRAAHARAEPGAAGAAWSYTPPHGRCLVSSPSQRPRRAAPDSTRLPVTATALIGHETRSRGRRKRSDEQSRAGGAGQW